MPRYIPPSLRQQADNPSDSDSTTKGGSNNNAAPSAPRSLTQLESTTPQRPLHTLDEIHAHYNSTCERSTLNDSKEHPKELSYIILFPGANPRWKPDRIIFAKTNVDILPGYEKFKTALDEETTKQGEAAAEVGASEGNSVDGVAQQDARTATAANSSNPLATTAAKPHSASDHANIEPESNSTTTVTAAAPPNEPITYSTRPIPVFLDLSFKYTPRKYCFHGCFTPLRIDFLKPGSPELVRMLEQKFTQPSTRGGGQSTRGDGGYRGRGRGETQASPKQRERDPAAWKQSLSFEWAMLQMRQVPDDEVEMLGEPRIERLEEDDAGAKGTGGGGLRYPKPPGQASSTSEKGLLGVEESQELRVENGVDEKKLRAELEEVEVGLAEQSVA